MLLTIPMMHLLIIFQAIFKETQRPSREMQQTIAEHLRLDMSTVSNFFMNARRRSRNGSVIDDEPAPYQQIRPITPPPDSPSTTPTQRQPTNRPRVFKTELSSLTDHLDEAVSAVAHGGRFDSSLLNSDDANFADILDGNIHGQLLDQNDDDWDDSDVRDIKPEREEFINDEFEENEGDQSKTENSNFPRSVDNHTALSPESPVSVKAPASAPGSVQHAQ